MKKYIHFEYNDHFNNDNDDDDNDYDFSLLLHCCIAYRNSTIKKKYFLFSTLYFCNL